MNLPKHIEEMCHCVRTDRLHRKDIYQHHTFDKCWSPLPKEQDVEKNKDLLIKEEVEKIDNLLPMKITPHIEHVDMKYINFIKLIESSLSKIYEEGRKIGIEIGQKDFEFQMIKSQRGKAN